MSRPQLTALIDQADAAAAHGAAIMHTLAELGGGEVVREIASPLIRGIAGRMTSRAARGQLTFCPHITPSAPQPMFWVPWAPGRLRCPACVTAAQKRIRGTKEDNICDNCRRHSAMIHNEGAQPAPAVVLDMPSSAAAFGPVTVLFGLCPSCHEEAFS
jgi:hypothetical protein